MRSMSPVVLSAIAVIAFRLPLQAGSPAGAKPQDRRIQTTPAQENLESRLSRSLAELRSDKPADPNPEDARIPPAVRRALASAKRGLRDLVMEELERAGAGAGPAAVQDAVHKRLHAAGLRIWNEREAQQEEDFCPSGFGCIDGLRVSAPRGAGGPMVFLTSLGIPCGEDQSVYVATLKGAHWRLRLADESRDYATIDGAQEGTQFALMSGASPKSWSLVTAGYRPMCSSPWRSARVRVLRPTADPDHPVVEMKDARTLYTGVDHPIDLKVYPGRFEMTAAGENRINPEDAYQTFVYSFRRAKAGWRRVQPVALTADGFVDEWIFSPWLLAQEWIEKEALARLRFWHEKLQRLDVKGEDGYEVGTEITALQACDARETLWQVGMAIDDPKRRLPEDLTFVVRKDGEKFLLQGVYLDPPSGCPSTAVAQSVSPLSGVRPGR